VCDIHSHVSSAASRHFALTHASGLPHTGCAQSRAAARRADPQTSAGSVLLPQEKAPPASVSTAGPPDGAAAPVTWPSTIFGMDFLRGTHTACGTLTIHEMDAGL